MSATQPPPLMTQTELGALRAPDSVSVLSFNLLAPCFVRVPGQPWNAYAHSRDADLDWTGRQARIIEILLAVDADLVCLQEVQLEERADGWGTPAWLETGALGTRYTAIPQPFSPKRAGKMAARNESVVGQRTVTALVTLVRKGWSTQPPAGGSRSLTVVVEHPVFGAISLTNCHLEGNPEKVEVQQQQLRSALKRAEAPGLTQQILIGDFNGEMVPGSGLGEILTAPPGEQASWQRVPSGPTLSSPGKAFTVDHALYGSGLAPTQVTAWMTPALVASGLPAQGWPSDHLPLGVCFRRSG